MSGTSDTKIRKRKKWPIVAGAVAAVLAVGIIGTTLTVKPASAADSGYQEAFVEKGSIVNTVVGSGTLEYGDTIDIKAPTGIKIDEVLVEEGERVQDGQALATVDMSSLQIKLADVQKQINDLDEEINNTKDDTESDVIKSHVSGRVKIVNAKEGSEAADIMMESGSLMTISIDGKMAVDFESDAALSSGDRVDVVFPDESAKDGTVTQKINGGYTVTLTDNGPKVGEAVTIADQDGNTLGEGSLYINNPITIAGTGGIIETIHAEENDTVSKGSKLITLDGVSASAEHLRLQSERADLLDTYNSLVAISQSGTISASGSGTVETIYVTEGAAVTATSSANSASAAAQPSAGAAQQAQVNPSLAGMLASGTSDHPVSVQAVAETIPDGIVTMAETADPSEITPAPTEIDLSGLSLAAPVTGATPQGSIDGSPAYTGTVAWLPADPVFAADTAYTAAVSLTANTGYQFNPAAMPMIENTTLTNIAVNADAQTLTFNATYARTMADESAKQALPGGAQYGQPGTGSIDFSSLQNGSAYAGGFSGSMSAASGATSTDAPSAASSSGNEAAAFTIATDAEMLLAIDVDELDINSISEGMDASIVFDAMEDTTFEGTIRSVADAANSSAGVSKYTAKIYMPKDPAMWAGMNATATIVIEQLDDILTIPVDALQERGSTVFVYTQLDQETGLPQGEKEVETGISDGESVQITGGLSEGDAVYYVMDTGGSSISLPFGQLEVGSGQGGFPFGG